MRAYLPPGLRETYAASLQLPTSAVRSHADRVDLASEADFPPLAGSGPSGGSAAHAARRPASAPSPRKSGFAGSGGGSVHSSGGPSTPTQAGKAADGPSSPCLGSDSEGSLGHAASSSASVEAEADPPAAAAAPEAEAAPAVEAVAPLAAPVSCSEAVSWANACEEAEREEREGAEGRALPAGAAVALAAPFPAAPSVPIGGSSAGAEQCEGLQLPPQEEAAAEAEPALQAPETFSAQQSIVAAGPQGGGDSSPAWAPAAHEEPEAPPAHSQATACPMPEAPPSPAVEFSLAHTGSPAASPAPMPGSAAAQPHLPPASPLRHAQPQMGHATLPLEAAYMPPSLVPPAAPAPAVPAGAGEQGTPPGWQAAGPAPATPPAQSAAVAFGIHCLATFRCPLTKVSQRPSLAGQGWCFAGPPWQALELHWGVAERHDAVLSPCETRATFSTVHTSVHAFSLQVQARLLCTCKNACCRTPTGACLTPPGAKLMPFVCLYLLLPAPPTLERTHSRIHPLSIARPPAPTFAAGLQGPGVGTGRLHLRACSN